MKTTWRLYLLAYLLSLTEYISQSYSGNIQAVWNLQPMDQYEFLGEAATISHTFPSPHYPKMTYSL